VRVDTCAHLCKRVRACREQLKQPLPSFFHDANRQEGQVGDETLNDARQRPRWSARTTGRFLRGRDLICAPIKTSIDIVLFLF
jgi:hypothetical protein